MLQPVEYARISDDREGAGLGVDRQFKECDELAVREGLPKPTRLSDNDMSAYRKKRRPDFERLLDGLAAGQWNVLVAWHVDRLVRNLKDLVRLVEVVVEKKIKVYVVRGGVIDMSTPEGQLQIVLLGAIAQYESAHKSARIRAKIRQLAEAGKHRGRRAYGWARPETGLDPTDIDPDEGPIVATIISRIAAGDSLYQIADDLRTADAPRPRGGATWNPTIVKQIASRHRNIAWCIHRRELVRGFDGTPIVAEWKPIVPADLWHQAMAILTSPQRKAPPGNRPVWLLSCIARCCCGSVVVCSRTGGVAVYRCRAGLEGDKTRRHTSRNAAYVDDHVTRTIQHILDQRQGATHHLPVPQAGPAPLFDAEHLAAQISLIEDALAGNPAPHLVGVSHDALHRNLLRHKGNLATTEGARVLALMPGPLVGVTADNFPHLHIERRRAVIRELVTVDFTAISKGTRPDESNIIVRASERYAIPQQQAAASQAVSAVP